jgi:hypothetical protein
MSLATAELTFAKFLMGYDRDDAIGDLSHDFQRDPNAPRTDRALLEYLRAQAGCDGPVRHAVESSWKSYRRARKKVGLS